MNFSYEAYGYLCLGQSYYFDRNDKSVNIQIGYYYKKAQEIYDSVVDEQKSREILIRFRDKLRGRNVMDLESLKRAYYKTLEESGENSEEGIMTGITMQPPYIVPNIRSKPSGFLLDLHARTLDFHRVMRLLDTMRYVMIMMVRFVSLLDLLRTTIH